MQLLLSQLKERSDRGEPEDDALPCCQLKAQSFVHVSAISYKVHSTYITALQLKKLLHVH